MEIAENKQEEQENIVLEEKCDIPGHQNYDLVAVCLDEECEAEKRLCCSKCLVFNHGEHTSACLFLEDLKDPKKVALKAWSKDNLGKQVEQYLKENENIEQEIEDMMDNLMEDIIEETNKAKNIMRRKRIEGKTEVQKTAKQIQAKYESAYDIKHIRSILVDFMGDKIEEDVLNDKLEDIIKAREEIEDLNRKNKLVANYPVIDKQFLQEKQESLLEIISSLSNTIRIPNAWQLLKAKGGNQNLIKEIVPGKSFDFSENQASQVVYGSEIMKEGQHTWVIKIQMIKKEKKNEDDDDDEEEKEQENNNNNNNNNNNQFGGGGAFGGGGGFGGGGFGGGGFGAFGNGVNFNHPDYQAIRNLYIGIVNDKKKDTTQNYNLNNGMGQDVHGLDVVRNGVIGGYLFFSGQFQKQMSQVFWDKRANGLEIHLTLDIDNQKMIIKDRDHETQYEANFQGVFKGQSWRPYVQSVRSRLNVQLVSSLNN